MFYAYILIPTVIAIALFFIIVNYRARIFVEKYSKSYRDILEVNDRYEFAYESLVSYMHTYDNENFFNDISCRDYLIYQLQFEAKKIIAKENMNSKEIVLYKQYKKEFLEKAIYGVFDRSCHKWFMHFVEKQEVKILDNLMYSPVEEFHVDVILKISTIDGRVYGNKCQTFYIDEIKDVCFRLNQKRDNFYLDEDIWNSISRVERGKVSNKLRFKVYARDGYRCQICGKSQNRAYLEIDHIYPISKGGKTTYNNLQTLCHECNKRKGNRIYY